MYGVSMPQSTPVDMYHNHQNLFGGLVVRRQKSAPYVSMKTPHWHDGWEFYYLVGGQRKFFLGSETYDICAGDLVVINKRVMHRVQWQGDASHERFFVFVPNSYMQSLDQGSVIGSLSSRVVHVPRNLRGTLQGILSEMNYEYGVADRHSALVLRMDVVRLLVFIDRLDGMALAEMPQSHQPLVLQAQALMKDLYQTPLTLDDIANRCGVGPEYLSRTFSTAVGLPLWQYLSQVRISHAAQLLLTSNDSVQQIARACGFSSPNYMGQVFKKLMGISPRSYRTQRLQALGSTLPAKEAGEPGAGIGDRGDIGVEVLPLEAEHRPGDAQGSDD